MQENAPLDRLTEREETILQRLVAGLSDQQIAGELFLSLNTVKWYNRQIYSKMGVRSRIQVIAHAKNLALPENVVADALHSAPDSHLPMQTTLFIGRDREIRETQHLLHTCRLLTLTGTGGTGKTRLALRLTREIAGEFADGVYFVDLAPLSDHAQVRQAIAGALGIFEHSTESLAVTLKRALAGQEVLLLLDNFEHVMEDAPLVSELLETAPRLKVLVTSREPLRLADEQVYPVPPLTLPDQEVPSVEQLMAAEAGQFFVRRAQMAQPRFELSEATAPLIGQICIRLAGLPLALELAAARCKLFSPRTLLERLGETGESSLSLLTRGSRNAPPRQQTLRASIEWSYNLLDKPEKLLLERLAVFRGGCSLEAIEYVCTPDLALDVLDGLASLIDKNLVQQTETPEGELRFGMLEMIHAYAHERLTESGEEENVRRRHTAYFVELAERAEPELRLAKYTFWSERLERDLENIRAVLEWSLKYGDITSGARLAGSLCLFWYGNGHHVEGYQWTQQLLRRLDEVPLIYRPRLLLSAGHVTCMRSLEQGMPLFAQSLAFSRKLGDRLQIAWALALLAYTQLPEPSIALPHVEESLAIFRELDHLPGIAQALNIIGEIARFNGDDDAARRAYEECLAVSQQTGETRRIVLIYKNLAFIALHTGDARQARDLELQALRLARTSHNQLELAKSLVTIGGAIGESGQLQQAACLFGASEIALERLGAFHQPNDKPEVDLIVDSVRAQLDEATFLENWTKGRALTLERAIALALEQRD